MDIGKRVYFDIKTGEVILNTGERSGDVIPLTPAQEIKTYQALRERVPGTFSYVEFEYGVHREQESLGGYISKIDITSVGNKPIFSYPKTDGSVEETPLNPYDKIEQLEKDKEELLKKYENQKKATELLNLTMLDLVDAVYSK